jgi:hypothetical protein
MGIAVAVLAGALVMGIAVGVATPGLDGIGIGIAAGACVLAPPSLGGMGMSPEGCAPGGVFPPIGIGVEPSATGGWLEVPFEGIGIAGPAGGSAVGPAGGIDIAAPGGMGWSDVFGSAVGDTSLPRIALGFCGRAIPSQGSVASWPVTTTSAANAAAHEISDFMSLVVPPRRETDESALHSYQRAGPGAIALSAYKLRRDHAITRDGTRTCRSVIDTGG